MNQLSPRPPPAHEFVDLTLSSWELFSLLSDLTLLFVNSALAFFLSLGAEGLMSTRLMPVVKRMTSCRCRQPITVIDASRTNNEKNDCQPQEPRDRSMRGKAGRTRSFLCVLLLLLVVSVLGSMAQTLPFPQGANSAPSQTRLESSLKSRGGMSVSQTEVPTVVQVDPKWCAPPAARQHPTPWS